jgi:hypothetical protein
MRLTSSSLIAVGTRHEVRRRKPMSTKAILFWRLLTLDNVIVAPRAICWTDELFHRNRLAVCRAILDAAAGRIPEHVVNHAVLEQHGLQSKLADGRRPN